MTEILLYKCIDHRTYILTSIMEVICFSWSW